LSIWAPQLASVDTVPQSLLGAEYAVADLTLCAPIEDGARIFCIGANYAKHIAGVLSDLPSESPGFIKPRSAIVDPGDMCRFPPHHEKLDYEVELVAMLASPLVAGRRPTESLLGYTIGNDGSVRDVTRILGVDLYSMKAQDRSSPVGPWITTLGELGGAAQPDLVMTTHVNGDLRQNDSTRDMIFPVDFILEYINERNQLQSGDLVFTGTIAGTAHDGGHEWLKPGDKVSMSIAGIGTLDFSIGPKHDGGQSVVQRRAAGERGLGT
jgi:2-keto-4-pentenoate hydratase/2-oxohepta-3-ene-1,7-dioic acid hydratase in catechol pathway